MKPGCVPRAWRGVGHEIARGVDHPSVGRLSAVCGLICVWLSSSRGYPLSSSCQDVRHRDIDNTICPWRNTVGIRRADIRDAVRDPLREIGNIPAFLGILIVKGFPKFRAADTWGNTVSVSAMASNSFRWLRVRGPRGMAVECALVAFFVAFEVIQVLFVVSASAT